MLWKKKVILELGKETGLYLIEDFLSARECGLLIMLAKKKGFAEKTFHLDQKKKSKKISGMARFTHHENATVSAITERMHDLTQFPVEFGEHMKVVSYYEGGSVSEIHNDYETPIGFTKQRGGLRIAQMLLYLNDVEEGGETWFPNIGIKVVPKRGRALLWYGIKNMHLPEKGEEFLLPKVFKSNPYAQHQPRPIIKGEKFIAVKMLHNCHSINPTIVKKEAV